MEYDVTFIKGIDALGGARRCLLRRLAAGAGAVLLQSVEDEGRCLILGDVRLVAPEDGISLTAEEGAALGRAPYTGGDGVEVFCRLFIPEDDPLSAGFDLSRLMLVDTATGTGLEASRPGAAPVLLKAGSTGD